MPKSAVEEFIEVQGAATLRDASGLSMSAIRVWKHRHIIPRSAWPQLIEAKIASLQELLEIERLSRPFAEMRAQKGAA